jgi:5'-deoxynucleotidase YfbR-like HD superfamily hydrolase
MTIDVCNDLRMAGRVLRYHTWPHIRPTTNAEHSWNVARIIMSIVPNPHMSNVLVKYAIIHDCAEITTGDLPYPIKKNNPVLDEEIKRIETDALSALVAEWALPGSIYNKDQLTITEKWAFKLAEFIEMWEWGLEEQLLGNTFAKKVADRCIAVVWEYLRHPDGHETIREAARNYITKRRALWTGEENVISK